MHILFLVSSLGRLYMTHQSLDIILTFLYLLNGVNILKNVDINLAWVHIQLINDISLLWIIHYKLFTTLFIAQVDFAGISITKRLLQVDLNRILGYLSKGSQELILELLQTGTFRLFQALCEKCHKSISFILKIIQSAVDELWLIDKVSPQFFEDDHSTLYRFALEISFDGRLNPHMKKCSDFDVLYGLFLNYIANIFIELLLQDLFLIAV